MTPTATHWPAETVKVVLTRLKAAPFPAGSLDRKLQNHLVCAQPRHEHAQELGEGDCNCGDEAGLDDQKHGPAVEEPPDRAERISEKDVLPAGVRHHPGQLGVAQGADDRHDAGEDPDDHEPAGRADFARDFRRNNEDAGANHGPGDEHGGVKKAELPLKRVACRVRDRTFRRRRKRTHVRTLQGYGRTGVSSLPVALALRGIDGRVRR